MLMLACDEMLQDLIDRGDFLPIVAVVFGCLTGMVGIVFGSIAGIMKSRAAEESRREIAAFVAEGSIRPEDAVAMIKAGKAAAKTGGCC
ncbi:MAG: hypothetical protein ACYTJ0_02155 [Planctomycetota bacterium]|jgi:hypothetical protein